jgi:hypothetical protein
MADVVAYPRIAVAVGIVATAYLRIVVEYCTVQCNYKHNVCVCVCVCVCVRACVRVRACVCVQVEYCTMQLQTPPPTHTQHIHS